MQSGISASQSLFTTFNDLVSTPTSRAVLATITNERIEPLQSIPSTSSTATFTTDLPLLSPHLHPDRALYILLKLDSTPTGYAAITYVPNSAPVRQKMLFAATRLQLVRDLGVERFRETLFVTDAAELTPEGWAKHEAHVALAAPLTEEERGLEGARRDEEREYTGTAARRGHVDSRVEVKVAPGVVEALASLREEGCRGTLVQLKFALPDETLLLESSTDGVGVEEVVGLLSGQEPRFAFYSSAEVGLVEPRVVFLYTCPTASKVRERMVYSTSKSWVRTVAERDAGIVVKKSLEATDPADLEVEQFLENSVSKKEDTEPAAKTFSRPRRPGGRR